MHGVIVGNTDNHSMRWKTKKSFGTIRFRRTDRATDEARTRGLHLGKVALYQLSYYRIPYDP